MPITTSTTVYDTDGATNSYLHDVTIVPSLDGAKDATRLRRATGYNFGLNPGPSESVYRRRNNFAQISVDNITFKRVDLNQAEREFLEAMGPTNGFLAPGTAIGPGSVALGGNVLISVFGLNPRVRANGQYLIFTDLYRIFAPSLFHSHSRFPDFAMDVDLPAPWSSTCRLIYRNGTPFLSARTPPGGWVRYMQRAPASEHFRCHLYDAAAQVYPLGDAMVSQWWAFGTHCEGQGARNSIIDPAAIPELRHSGGTFSIPAYAIDDTDPMAPVYSDIRDISLRGQWYSQDHNVGGDYTHQPGAALGSDFAIPYTDTTGGSGGTALIVPDITAALTPPPLTVADSPVLIVTLKSTIHRTVAGNYDIVQEIARTGLNPSSRFNGGSGGNLWVPTFIPPPYYPWDVKLNQFGPNESGITWTTHNGYIPTSVPTVPMTDAAPTLFRDGQVVYLRGGRDMWDATAPAAYTTYLAAMAAAAAAHEAAYAAADAAYAAAIAGPEATLNAALASAAATRDAAYAAAQATLDASPGDPSDYDDYYAAIYAADDAYYIAADAAYTAFYAATAADAATRDAAYAAADATRSAAETAAITAYNAAAEADWYAGQVKPTTPAGGGFAYPTDLSRANINQQESSGRLRIWCPELGQEWAVGYSVGRVDEVVVDGSATGANPPYHAGYAYSGVKKSATSFTTIGTCNYPGPAITLPSSTIGKALFAEVTCAQAHGQAGGYRRTIRRWNPTVP